MSEGDESKVWVHLYGGEQDGWRRQIELRSGVPTKFYVWHVDDEKIIEKAKGKDRMVVQSKLATMAYEKFDSIEVEGKIEHRYRRLESADKVAADPAV